MDLESISRKGVQVQILLRAPMIDYKHNGGFMKREENKIIYSTKLDKKITEPWKLKLKLIAKTDKNEFKNYEDYLTYMKNMFKRIDAGEQI